MPGEAAPDQQGVAKLPAGLRVAHGGGAPQRAEVGGDSCRCIKCVMLFYMLIWPLYVHSTYARGSGAVPSRGVIIFLLVGWVL